MPNEEKKAGHKSNQNSMMGDIKSNAAKDGGLFADKQTLGSDYRCPCGATRDSHCCRSCGLQSAMSIFIHGVQLLDDIFNIFIL